MPLTLVGMTRVFLDGMDRDPPVSSQHNHDDTQEINTITSTVSEYALSDDGIEEADFPSDTEEPTTTIMEEEEEEEEEQLSSSTLSDFTMVDTEKNESRIHEAEPHDDETSCHDTSSFHGLRIPSPNDHGIYSFLPSILVTEIDDFNIHSSSSSQPKNSRTISDARYPCALMQRSVDSYSGKAVITRTTNMFRTNRHPTVSSKGTNQGGSIGALGVSELRLQTH